MFLSQEEAEILASLEPGEITTGQACEILETSRQTLFNIRNDGILPYRKASRRIIVYKQEDVEKVREMRGEQIRKRRDAQWASPSLG